MEEIITERYKDQVQRWPPRGKHILAQYTEDAVLVYQAFNREIAQYAVENNKFGGPHYSTSRMTWIKTNFLWMMYRSGWGTKHNQEVTLGIWVKKSAFEDILANASPAFSTKEEKKKYLSEQTGESKLWKRGSKKNKKTANDKDVDGDLEPENSGKKKKGKKYESHEENFRVRLQWDPDHNPDGSKTTYRRAVQLGIKKFEGFITGEAIVKIVDLSEFVTEQRKLVGVNGNQDLITPKEWVYEVKNEDVRRRVQVDTV